MSTPSPTQWPTDRGTGTARFDPQTSSRTLISRSRRLPASSAITKRMTYSLSMNQVLWSLPSFSIRVAWTWCFEFRADRVDNSSC